MQIDINTKASQLCEFMIVVQPCQKIPLDVLNQIFSKINTMISLLNNSGDNKLPDDTMKMFYDFLDELKLALEKIVNEDNSFFSHLRKIFSGSSLNHLKTLISKLDTVYQRIISNLSIKIPSLNLKRKIPQNEENSDDLEDELEKNEKGYKKVKVALEDRKVNFENTPQAPFYVKFIYDTSIQQSFSEENRINHSNPFGEDGKSNMMIKREQFARLPNETVMRLSKDHCNVLAVKQVSDTHYEIKDLSMNGIFLLGNSINKTMEHPPKRLSKLESYSIKHGDLIGLLMKKDAPQELLLGFEFCATNF